MLVKLWRLGVYCLIAVLAASGSSLADDTEAIEPGVGERVDEFFNRFEAFGFQGSVLVATADGVVLRKGYGFADRQRGVHNTPSTAFGIASLDKQFTAAAILVLERQGKLKTSDLISAHIDGVPSDKAEITIAHLLNHRSGLPNTYRDSYSKLTFPAFVAKVLDTKLAAPVGTKRVYSNSGYYLLEFIIERVSGMEYEAFLSEHLFQPAGMKSSGQHLVSFANDQRAKYRTTRSQQALLKLEPKRPDAFLSFRSTVGDFYRWHLALQGDKVLPADVKQKLFRPLVGNYANGWFIGNTSRETPVQYHGGYDTAVHLFAMLYRYPAEDTVIIVFGNTTMNDTLNRTYLSVIVERLIFGGKVNLPPAAASISADELQPFEGRFQLDDGGEFQIRRDETGLSVTAFGRKAAQALVYPDAKSERDAHVLDPKISEVMFGFERGDYAPLQTVLLKEASFESARKKWEQRWRRYRARNGSLKSVRAIHRLETEYQGVPEIQTHLILEFEKGTRLVRALANADGRYWFDLINLPGKFEARLVPVSKTELVAWNLKLQSGPRFVLGDPEGQSLIIQGKAARFTATRQTSN